MEQQQNGRRMWLEEEDTAVLKQLICPGYDAAGQTQLQTFPLCEAAESSLATDNMMSCWCAL